MKQNYITRRRFLKTATFGSAACLAGAARWSSAQETSRPNIILCMADDMGWGDVGYNGHPRMRTPYLDDMARSALRFDRFYAGGPASSPTRGACLTGRHPNRYGIFDSDVGHLPEDEVTLAEVTKSLGYVTGHFGKWHLGRLSKQQRDSQRGGPESIEDYSPPWNHGFDVCFSTESEVPTFDPMINPVGFAGTTPGSVFGTRYWASEGQRAHGNLAGDDSKMIMDRAIRFIEKAALSEIPFFAVIWFHAPHMPTIAGPRHRGQYEDLPEEAQHYFGSITALDQQVGRLRNFLGSLQNGENTMLWFCSDNGPAGEKDLKTNGTAGFLQGRKGSLYEGGVRVPGLLEWPAKITTPRIVEMPASALDYFPTTLEVLGVNADDYPSPRDGVSLVPLIDGKTSSRPSPIAFGSDNQSALIDNHYKLISVNNGQTYSLFDLTNDPSESNDLAFSKPALATSLKGTLDAWRASCRKSLAGEDYKAVGA